MRLINKFKRESSIFINIEIDGYQTVMLNKALNVTKRLIKNRLTVQFYIQKYRGDSFWSS